MQEIGEIIFEIYEENRIKKNLAKKKKKKKNTVDSKGEEED